MGKHADKAATTLSLVEAIAPGAIASVLGSLRGGSKTPKKEDPETIAAAQEKRARKAAKRARDAERAAAGKDERGV